jgi:hypothetical protein
MHNDHTYSRLEYNVSLVLFLMTLASIYIFILSSSLISVHPTSSRRCPLLPVTPLDTCQPPSPFLPLKGPLCPPFWVHPLRLISLLFTIFSIIWIYKVHPPLLYPCLFILFSLSLPPPSAPIPPSFPLYLSNLFCSVPSYYPLLPSFSPPPPPHVTSSFASCCAVQNPQPDS